MSTENPKNSMEKSGELFSRLIVANQNRIYGFIRTFVFQREAANDLMQEVSSTAWLKFDSFDQETDFAAWAMSIARYKILNWQRSQEKLPLNLNQSQFDLLADKTVALNCQTDLRRDALESCLKGLSERHRQLLSDRYQSGKTVQVIAKQCGKTRVAIHRQLARIHAILLQCIDQKVNTLNS